MRRLAGVLAVAALLAACATPPPAGPTAPLTATRALVLPAPADLGRRVEALHLVRLRHEAVSMAFEVRISVTPERLDMVGLDTLGRRMLTLSWTAGRLEARTAPWMPDVFRPEVMLADIILLYWPVEAVRAALARSGGGELIAEPGRRIVRIDGRDVLLAEYPEGAAAAWSGTVHYRNASWGYEIDVLSRELTG